MPEISRFYGIVIAIFFGERPHTERPHFHATYAGSERLGRYRHLAVLAGSLPANRLHLVMRWARIHQPELLANWQHARKGEPLEPIQPLP